MTFRKRRLVHPGLQLRLIAEFAGLALMGLILQFILLAWRLPRAVEGMESDGQVMDALPGVLLEVSGFSLVILLPLLIAFGILFTFRIAGPAYRFEQFLRAVASGEQTEPCRIRENDDLQELCERINEGTEEQRKRNAEAGSARGADELRQAG